MPRPASTPPGNNSHAFWAALTLAYTFHASGVTDIKGSNNGSVTGATLSDSLGLIMSSESDHADIGIPVAMSNGYSVMFRVEMDAVAGSQVWGSSGEAFSLNTGDQASYQSGLNVTFPVTSSEMVDLYDYCVAVSPEAGSIHTVTLFRKLASASMWTEIAGSGNFFDFSPTDRLVDRIGIGNIGGGGAVGAIEYFYVFDGTSFSKTQLDAEFADPYSIVSASGGGSGTEVTLGTATETNAAGAAVVVNPKTVTLGTAAESNSTAALAVQKQLTLDTALEVNVGGSAEAVAGQVITLGTAFESSAADPLSTVGGNPKSVTVSLATESDTAIAITPDRTVLVGQAVEGNTAGSVEIPGGSFYLPFHRNMVG
ncbi:MAG: hypothetical protein AAFX06_28285 [Planctomycetota bacterium]